jgi:hypothetical protein
MARESDLHEPLVTYLRGQGYTVHAEVRHCDLVARKGDELLVVELKNRLSLALLVQAAERKEYADSVYIAVPVPPGRSAPPNFKGVKRLLRRLEVGCILVDRMKRKTRVRIALHPYPFRERSAPAKRRAIIREIDGRYGEFDLAGQPVTTERITAYKQAAIRIAALLESHAPASPGELRKLGTGEKTQAILSANLYGWFERPRRGQYLLSEAGRAALRRYAELRQALFDGAGEGASS